MSWYVTHGFSPRRSRLARGASGAASDDKDDDAAAAAAVPLPLPLCAFCCATGMKRLSAGSVMSTRLSGTALPPPPRPKSLKSMLPNGPPPPSSTPRPRFLSFLLPPPKASPSPKTLPEAAPPPMPPPPPPPGPAKRIFQVFSRSKTSTPMPLSWSWIESAVAKSFDFLACTRWASIWLTVCSFTWTLPSSSRR